MYLIGGLIIFLIIILVCFNSIRKKIGALLLLVGILLLTSFTIVGVILILIGICMITL